MPGAGGGAGERLANGDRVQFCKMKSSGIYNNVNVLNATELYT